MKVCSKYKDKMLTTKYMLFTVSLLYLQLSGARKTLHVVFWNYDPFIYFENGACKGLIADVFKNITASCNNFEEKTIYHEFKSYRAFKQCFRKLNGKNEIKRNKKLNGRIKRNNKNKKSFKTSKQLSIKENTTSTDDTCSTVTKLHTEKMVEMFWFPRFTNRLQRSNVNAIPIYNTVYIISKDSLSIIHRIIKGIKACMIPLLVTLVVLFLASFLVWIFVSRIVMIILLKKPQLNNI